MNIVILNTTDDVGGAAIAARRIAQLYIQAGHSVQFICLKKKSDLKFSSPLVTNIFQKLIYAYKVRMEKKLVDKYTANQGFNFSTGWLGNSLKSNIHIQKADVIHLHWVNHTFLNITGMGEILKSGKKIIWTMHDMWLFTGGCHHSRGCLGFQSNCAPCPLLKEEYQEKISKMILEFKLKSFTVKNLTVVSPSNWLMDLAKSSKLLQGAIFSVIPNPIDVEVFSPTTNPSPNKKFTILFGAANALTNKQKGIDYLIEAIEIFKSKKPQIEFELQIFGTGDSHENPYIALPIKLLGNISGESYVAKLYQNADVFCLPSLEENLPNTIMESLSCGTPVIAFDTGGIKDMVETGITGYLAQYKSSEDLAKGFFEICSKGKSTYTESCRSKAIEMASFANVSKRYLQLLP